MLEARLFSLLVVAGSCVLVWRLRRVLREGSFPRVWLTRIDAQSRPMLFWLNVGIFALLALAMLILGVLGAAGVMERLAHN